MKRSLRDLNQEILNCKQCPRLRKWCSKVALEKKAAYRKELYWGKPVTGFGVARPRLLIIGLAPGAHGANRTGRMFTGDRSGDWLYRALFQSGFANQPLSQNLQDGLKLKDAYVTAIVRCAPPENRPTPPERDSCLPFLNRELDIFSDLRILVCLGSFAWDNTIRALKDRGLSVSPKPKFKHGKVLSLGPYTIFASYHPSQQNTFTKKLTEPMLRNVFQKAKRLLDA